ncbi:hypothetical protein ABQE48_04760 [Mycolicibacterium thermoresistibile]
MTDHISHRNTRYLGRLATACGTALLAFGLAANAAAVPDDDPWDIEEYDNCMGKTIRDPIKCCMDSGGIPDPTTPDEYGWPTCRAPSAVPEGSAGNPGPRVPPAVINTPPTAVGDPGQPPPLVPAPNVPVGPAMG